MERRPLRRRSNILSDQKGRSSAEENGFEFGGSGCDKRYWSPNTVWLDPNPDSYGHDYFHDLLDGGSVFQNQLYGEPRG